jgi:hypothetical protein
MRIRKEWNIFSLVNPQTFEMNSENTDYSNQPTKLELAHIFQ